jgi:adenosine/AMP kinase
MDISSVAVKTPEGCNVILGQAHFIKSVEDIYEALVSSVPGIKFGVAFCESSGPCLIRVEGNDEGLMGSAAKAAFEIGAGHSFLIFLKGAYPINVLNSLKDISEVCSIYCATANPIEVLIAEVNIGRGIIGIIDGQKPKGIEGEEQKRERVLFLRRLGYKR